MMQKWLKRISIILMILVVVIVAIVNLGMHLMKFTDLDAVEYFDEKGFVGEIKNVSINGHSIRIVADKAEESDSILLVFVHGAPGTWDAFKDYITDKDLGEGARVVAYDRPGYGGSDNEVMPSIKEQSTILKEVVKSYGLKKNVLIGHSYGGPIVGYTGLDESLNIDAVIMIAPLLDPVSEPLNWYSYFSYWKLTSWLLPRELVVAGSEKFAHENELEIIKNDWKNANCPYIHVHGLEDGLAPGIENIKFSRNNIPEGVLETITYDDKGHMVIWTDYDLMKKIILNVLNKL